MKKIGIALFISFLLINTTIMSWNCDTITKNIYKKPQETSENKPKISQIFEIDGFLNDSAWALAQYEDEFNLTVDEANGDVNGYNYMYLAEDFDNLYIGLDLCSDQTDDEEGEWLSIFLNTNESTFSSEAEWEDFRNNGMESLVYDVDRNKEYRFFKDYTAGGVREDFNSDNEYNVVKGSSEGDYTNFNDAPSDGSFNITSVENQTSQYVTWIDFEIDVKKWFNLFPELFIQEIQLLEFRILSRNNISISEHNLAVWYDNATYNLNDPNQVIKLNNESTSDYDEFKYGIGNMTENGIIRFSIYSKHDDPFKTKYTIFDFMLGYNYSQEIPATGLKYPYTSLNNYEIAWGFSNSSHNQTDHRMFEIRIPKSELEQYNTDTDLGVLVGGYGTMAMPDENFWVYSALSTIYMPEEDSSYYNYYDMALKPAPSLSPTISGDDDDDDDSATPAVPGYNLILILASIGIISIFILKKRYK
ncbi:MAG: hypothetical protein GF383_01305 [Candidatus Lokiarchaeota archaeon]|nr:hypothetical protein [Candidatus Lokiarchaeota archaeon]MBD3337903.1 hypothetical protein [Candidatus Lokiarchaeota archaeon]